MIKLLLKIPTGILSVLLTLAILYLCLAPQPIGGGGLFDFPGADKIMHFAMFFALSAAYLFDCAKAALPRQLRQWQVVAIAVAVILLGGLIEILQQLMGLGRSMDLLDFVADAIGVVCATGVMKASLLGRLSNTKDY